MQGSKVTCNELVRAVRGHINKVLVSANALNSSVISALEKAWRPWQSSETPVKKRNCFVRNLDLLAAAPLGRASSAT